MHDPGRYPLPGRQRRVFFSLECEGHLHVPRKHIETVLTKNSQTHQYQLGTWINNQRSRATTLTPQQTKQLTKITMQWT
ncbi:helicase associated domain-containing protein [Streptomyces sp. NPDC002533]